MSIADDFIADEYSLQSLTIQPCVKYTDDEIALGTATGFLVNYKNINFLVTNRHVLSGIDTNTGNVIHKQGAVPNLLRIFHHCNPELTVTGYGAWTLRFEDLIDDNEKPCWFSHPQWNCTRDMDYYWEKNIDIAVLPLLDTNNVGFHYVDIYSDEIIKKLPPGTQVSIVGFPLSLSNDFFPIWKTGHIASDVTTHHNQLYFYIDATTREGMSGSPVYFRNYTFNGESQICTQTYFVGIYSGRLGDNSEIGIVWRQKYIQETIEYAYANIETRHPTSNQ
jgi:hypothetical protein